MRHAKTEDPKPGQRDYDRALLSRGRADAAAMGLLLKAHTAIPQKILASPALRTTETATIICETYGIAENNIHFEERLYHAPAHILSHEIMATPSSIQTLMLIGHNPGISDFAYDCARETAIGFATAAFAVLEFEGEWTDFETNKKKLIHFTRPGGTTI